MSGLTGGIQGMQGTLFGIPYTRVSEYVDSSAKLSQCSR